LAEEANAELRGPGAAKGLERLETEHDNMRAALTWALKSKEADLALGLGGALWWFWSLRGYYGEGRRWLEGALAMDVRGSIESRAMALAGVGALATDQGDLDRAEEASAEGLELLEGGASERADAKPYLLLNLGHVDLEREEHDKATMAFEESLALSRKLGLGRWVASSVMSLATVSHKQGDLERATELYEEGIDLFREQGDRLGLAMCLSNLGLVMYSRGDIGRAIELTENGVLLLRELRVEAHTAVGLCNLGWMALLRSDLGRAAALFEEGLTLASDTGMEPIVLPALEGVACLAGARGEVRRAAQLWGAAQALQEAKGIPRDADWLAEADALISDVRSSLGEGAWQKAWKKGQTMAPEDAVFYALEEIRV
jgi:tetratricopeptide (TPR) repeat protein